MNDPFDVEVADRMADGCAIHRDSACLCDVDRDRFVCGDGPYKIPLVVQDAFLRHGEDWLREAALEVTRRTAIPAHVVNAFGRVTEIVRLLDQHPMLLDELRGIHETNETFKQMAERYGVDSRLVTTLARMLVVRPFVRRKNSRPEARKRFLYLYDVEGMSVPEAEKVMQAEGIEVARSTAYQWAQRHSQRKWEKVA